jgi:S1-C subfamily serine protease
VRDLYNSAGTLVETRKNSPEEIHPVAVQNGSLAALEFQAACGVAQSSSGAPAAPSAALSSGTAWLGPKGYLITANHVVDGATELILAQGGKYVGTAEVVVTDPANDIAVLKPMFTDGSHPPIVLAEAPAQLGEDVFTIGYPAPDQLGLSVKVTQGQVSALTGQDVATHRIDDARLMQVSVPVQSGNSGGPLMDMDGRVVGIIISKLDMTSSDEIAQNVNYALKIAYVRALLDGLRPLAADGRAKLVHTVVDAVAAHQAGVFLIIASKRASQ